MALGEAEFTGWGLGSPQNTASPSEATEGTHPRGYHDKLGLRLQVWSWLASLPGSLALIFLTLILSFCPCFQYLNAKSAKHLEHCFICFPLKDHILLVGIPHMEFRIILELKGAKRITCR